jgi:signal transduction histidine kinase
VEGHGIAGMRSRAEALGGALEVDATGGFKVVARIPLPS